VECLHSEDCASTDFVCSPSHTCVPPTGGCTAATCATAGLICAVEEGTCRACLSNPECGDLLCSGGVCSACAGGDNCGAGRICDGGRCVTEPGGICTRDADCDDRVCRFDGGVRTCVDCLTGDCGAGRTCTAGRCVADAPNCQGDLDCSPPATICQAGLCAPGCESGDCSEGQVCSPQTGRCVVTSTGTSALGATCVDHAQCASGVCFPLLDSNGAAQLICSRTCVGADSCPSEFVCYELGDYNLCYPKALLPQPAPPANDPPGTACINGETCHTGYCDSATLGGDRECIEMCARQADCDALGLSCLSALPIDDGGVISYYTQLCYEAPGTATKAAGELCASDTECASFWCVVTPDSNVPPRCASPCCSPADCGPPDSVCKPIFVFDGTWDEDEPFTFHKTCLWREYEGVKNVGEICDSNDECKSEICATGPSGQKRCTTTCCTNDECASYDWSTGCRPPFFGAHGVADDNFAALTRSLGRLTPDGVTISDAVAPLCMPR
jgi:hypothetical protein